MWQLSKACFDEDPLTRLRGAEQLRVLRREDTRVA
jgi:hypothetical protein